MPSVQNAHPIDAYFEWLVERTGCETYRGLLDILFHIPFWYSIAMDANRAEDGLYLRVLYGDQHDCTIEHLAGSCSVLEFLIALSDRVDQLTSYEHDPAYWFSYFLNNTKLDKYTDEYFDTHILYDIECDVDDRLHILLDHRYRYDGSNGGLFVCHKPEHDMRRVEVWWQMQYWLIEHFYEQ